MNVADFAPHDEPFILDRYQIIGQIASGGMASVSLGRLQGVGGFLRFVAIKRLHPHLAQEPEFVEMFLDEARLAAKIHHQNVVPILEIGENDGHYYIVMEYIEGATLGRIMARAIARELPIARPVLLRIIVDALSGLQAAHLAQDELGKPLGIVHRDVSPQNILIGTDGCTRITDFGVARATARLHNTRAGSMKGKLAYMAPEQTKGDHLDLRADLFAMGIVLWEVLAGRRLFKGQSEAQTLARVLIDPIPRLRSVLPDVHPALDEVVARSLERDPEKRFQTAAEMADAIERAARVAEWGRSNMVAQSEPPGSMRGDKSGAPPDSAPVANVRDVAALVKDACGDDISSQREAVRTWLAATPSAVFPAVGVPQSGRISAPPGSRRSPSAAPQSHRGSATGVAPEPVSSSQSKTIARASAAERQSNSRPPGSRAPAARVAAPGDVAGQAAPLHSQPATNRTWPPGRPGDAGDDIGDEAPDPPVSRPPARPPLLASPNDLGPTTYQSPETPRSRKGSPLPWILLGVALLACAGVVVFFTVGQPSSAAKGSAPKASALDADAQTAKAQPSAVSAPAQPLASATSNPTASAAGAESANAVASSSAASSGPHVTGAVPPVIGSTPTVAGSQKKGSEVEDLKNPYH